MKAWIPVVMLCACAPSKPAEQPDSGVSVIDASVVTEEDAGVTEEPMDAGQVAPTTSLAIRAMGVERTITRAQLGLEHGDGGVTGIYIEAYAGGSEACPDEHSPTPDYTLILSGIPVVTDGTAVTTENGLRVVLLDFVGDLTPSPAPLRAGHATLTVGHLVTTEDAVLDGTLDAVFDGGSILGTLHANHCPSLDD